MAVTVIKANQNVVSTTIVVDTTTNGTAQSNTTSAAGTLYAVEIDNTNNAGHVYFKMADVLVGTAGTTAADLVFAATGSKTTNFNMPNGITFINGFTHWCVTSATGSSTTNPGSAVTTRYTVVDS